VGEAVSRKIWAVEEGSYSDYSVKALFERQEDADAAHAAGLGDDVSEFVLFGPGELPRKVGYWRAYGRLFLDGRREGPRAYPQSGWSSIGEFDPPTRPKVTEYRPMPGFIDFHSEAMTEKAAIKAVSDRMAQRAAEALEPQSMLPAGMALPTVDDGKKDLGATP
jgi:hypothetical protein